MSVEPEAQLRIVAFPPWSPDPELEALYAQNRFFVRMEIPPGTDPALLVLPPE